MLKHISTCWFNLVIWCLFDVWRRCWISKRSGICRLWPNGCPQNNKGVSLGPLLTTPTKAWHTTHKKINAYFWYNLGVSPWCCIFACFFNVFSTTLCHCKIRNIGPGPQEPLQNSETLTKPYNSWTYRHSMPFRLKDFFEDWHKSNGGEKLALIFFVGAGAYTSGSITYQARKSRSKQLKAYYLIWVGWFRMLLDVYKESWRCV